MNLSQLKKVNRWRDGFNPLRGLTMMQAVALLESGERGEYANIQWLFRAVERRNATLRAVKMRRLSSVTRLDWTIKQIEAAPTNVDAGIENRSGVSIAEVPSIKRGGAERRGVSTPIGHLVTSDSKSLQNSASSGLQSLAAAQAAVLQEAYNRIDNLREAIGFIELAEFRGYSHLEKHWTDDGQIAHLEPVPQWLLFRLGLNAAWQYNATARGGSPTDEDPVLDPANFLIREVEDPIDEIAVLAHLRQSLSQKDWDGFVETYGIPPLFIELPPNIPADKEALYQMQAELVIGDARGTMPNGAKVQTVDAGARGNNPFSEHIRYQDECIVLAGTGGLLTVLSESGTGTLAGNAHQNTFDEIARSEALKISEVFQKQFDAPLLAEKFPGQPILAFFEIKPPEAFSSQSAVISKK